MSDAFPLQWPPGWPRTAPSGQLCGDLAFKRQVDTGRGYKSGRPWTFAAARDALLAEAWRHTTAGVVISSNFQPGKDGPQEGRRRPVDQGVAIYLTRNGKPYVMACDRYGDAEGNMRSLTLALTTAAPSNPHKIRGQILDPGSTLGSKPCCGPDYTSAPSCSIFSQNRTDQCC